MRYFLGTVFAIGFAFSAFGQSAGISFGQTSHDADAPVEITADELAVDQETGIAVFSGNVVAGQGEMRLTAARVKIEYLTEDGSSTGEIDKILASGGVTLVNGQEAAEAENAVYSPATAEVVMTGNVLVTQGPNAISGDKLTVDLTSGNGRVEGQVKTVFRTGNN